MSTSPTARDWGASGDIWAGIQQTNQGKVQRWHREEPKNGSAESSGVLYTPWREACPCPMSTEGNWGTLIAGPSKWPCSLSWTGHRSGVGLVALQKIMTVLHINSLAILGKQHSAWEFYRGPYSRRKGGDSFWHVFAYLCNGSKD